MFSDKALAVMKIRSKLLQAVRSWLNDKHYIEVQGPIIVPAFEDSACSFKVNYFGKKAYLAQGLNPYASVFAARLGQVFAITPAFRAENQRNRRHLAEYWRIHVAEQSGFDKIISVEEELVAHVCNFLSAESKEDLEFLDRPVERLARIHTPFPRLTYDEIVKLLRRDGFKIWWGQPIGWEMERHLSLRFKQPFFVTKYPLNTETLFFKPDLEKTELTLSVDLLAPEGYGEMSSGGEVVTAADVMLEKLNEMGISLAGQKWFMSFYNCSSPIMSQFGIGVERFMQWLCNLTDISDAVAFP